MMDVEPPIPDKAKIERAIAEEVEEHERRLRRVTPTFAGDFGLDEPFFESRSPSVNKRAQAAGSTEMPHQFKLALTVVSGVLRAKVASGTVSGRTPTMGGVALNAGPAPTVALSGAGTEILYLRTVATLSVTPKNYVVGFSALSATIEVGATVPDDDLTGIYCRQIATVVDGVQTSQDIANSIDLVVEDNGLGEGKASAIFHLSG